MATSEAPNKPRRHVAAIPCPGRGHINPLLNFCKLLVASHDVQVSFILTEEWLARLGSDSEPAISFLTIPSEPGKAAGVDGLFEAVQKHFEEPVKRLLDRLEPPPDVIIADSFLAWAVELGKRREIPVASFWPASANLFTVFYHHQLFVGSHFYPIQLSGASAEERIDFIPGIPWQIFQANSKPKIIMISPNLHRQHHRMRNASFSEQSMNSNKQHSPPRLCPNLPCGSRDSLLLSAPNDATRLYAMA